MIRGAVVRASHDCSAVLTTGRPNVTIRSGAASPSSSGTITSAVAQRGSATQAAGPFGDEHAADLV